IDDYYTSNILKFDSNCKLITKWGSIGSGNGQFVGPEGIAVDSSGSVYVSDNGNNRIQKFDSNGNFITKWDFKGSDIIQWDKPEGIAVDSSHNVYVTDYSGNSIIKCDSNGKLITKWITTNPEDIAIDRSGYVYVTDYHGILKFDSNGKLITKWGSIGSGNGQFIGSGGIAINSSGYVYVTDGGNNRIQVFAPVIPSILSTRDHNTNANSLIPDNATSTIEKMTTPQAGISDQV
ncbi:MAG: 6-bladed beta-propeller, partial [Thermoproteota archaeon]|nr:6-bladed beta-propeller [Thermoproteota archaeon]